MNTNQQAILRQALLMFAVLLAAPTAVAASVLKVATVFSHQAVLQREKPVPVWGWAEPGEAVTVEFAGQKKTATADAAGRWFVTLDPLPASAEPRELLVTAANPQSKIDKVKVSGILVGEVWLCAGGAEVGRRGTESDAAPDDSQAPSVRVFSITPRTARRPQTDLEGRWTAVQNAALKQLPAQACLLGRLLASELRVPVGVLSVSNPWPVESWMSREALAATPEALRVLLSYTSDAWKLRTVGTYEERLKAWTEYCQKHPLHPPPKPSPDVDTLATQGATGVWNATIAPLVPLAMRGVVWDQGEEKDFLAERGPFDIVHFNNGIHNFSRAQPGDERPYAEQLRTVVATIRASGAVCLFANSTGTIGDDVIRTSPRYLTNCRAFNAAAEAVMRELHVPVTDIYGLIQPRIKELIGSDLIHTNKEADELMADLIAQRLSETLAALPHRKP